MTRSSVRGRLAAAVALACALSTAGAARAAAPKYTALEITPPFGTNCEPHAVNSSGQVAGGVFTDATYLVGQGFLTGPGGAGITMVAPLDGGRAELIDIDDAGDAVGYSAAPGNTTTTSIGRPAATGTVVDLGGIGGVYSVPTAVNHSGQIVGFAIAADNSLGGYVSRKHLKGPLTPTGVQVFPQDIAADGAIVGAQLALDYSGEVAYLTGANGQGMTLLGSLGGGWSMALGVNRHHEVVGSSETIDGSTHAFVTDAGGGRVRDLGVPGSIVQARRINVHGQIVGDAQPGAGAPNWAFVADRSGRWWRLDQQTTLPAGVSLDSAADINDNGQIAARSVDQRCFLLTPVR